METIGSAWDVLMHILTTGPLGLWAPILGTLMAWGGTQAWKPWLPAEWDQGRRAFTLQMFAFALGTVVAGILNPTPVGIIGALIVGLWAPATWAIFVRVLGVAWPAAREALSSDPWKQL